MNQIKRRERRTVQVNVRLAPTTISQLRELAETYGSVTEAVVVAVERLYRALQQEQEPPTESA